MKPWPTFKKEAGGSAVEFAIILPVIFLFVFGITEWSLYLFNSHVVTNASREGARRGVVHASPRVSEDVISTAVLSYIGGNLVSFGAETPDIPPITICVDRGDDLTVTVNYNYTFLILPALTLGTVPETLPITASTIMRCE